MPQLWAACGYDSMNEVIAPHRWPSKHSFKRMLWSAAGSCALGGLFTWPLDHHYLRIERRIMPLRGLGKGFEGAKIAQVSDLHCSPIVLEKYLRQCVHAINDLDVDFVALTGDFITGPKTYAHRVARVLRDLSPRIASLACLGNHDYGIMHPNGFGAMRGLAEYLSHQIVSAGVDVLLNESRTFHRDGAAIQIVGLEDYWSPRYNPHQAFADLQADVPTVALCHNPDAASQITDFGAQWVLAGHTHGTSNKETRLHEIVMPITEQHFYAGEYNLGVDRHLYVNRGMAYARRWNLNARPEITVFTLKSL